MILCFAISLTQSSAQVPKEADWGTPRVRYMVNDVDSAISFYTKYLGFRTKQGPTPNFAILSRGNLELVLSTPFGPGGAAKPMLDSRKAEPGGWNRIFQPKSPVSVRFTCISATTSSRVPVDRKSWSMTLRATR